MYFSVVIPAYNCKNTLADTVNSVLSSGLFDFEILLIDDGSVDGTSEICDVLVAQHSNIRCIHQKNCGVSTARNCGIEAARGDYVLFFDSDDRVDLDALKHPAEITQQTLPDMLIFGLSFDYYCHGKLYRRDDLVCSREGMLSKAQWSAVFLELYECNALSPVWNKFIRRDILIVNQVRFRKDLIEMEDFLFTVQCMEHCGDIYLLPEAIYRYRQAENERSTFNRLIKIPSLTAYMQPFEDGIRQIVNQFSLGSKDLAAINDIVNRIYVSFFREQIHFGDTAMIEIAAKDMLYGKYAETIKSSDPKLFRLLAKGKYRRVWCQSAKIRLRHWIAVRVKYVGSLWRDLNER